MLLDRVGIDAVLLTSEAHAHAVVGVALPTGLPGFGSAIVTFGLVIFAFTTILGWSYYGERCAEFLFGVRVILPYRILWIIAIPAGALAAGDNIQIKVLWLTADVLNGLMAVPNLIALALLSPIVFRLTRDHLKRSAAE